MELFIQEQQDIKKGVIDYIIPTVTIEGVIEKGIQYDAEKAIIVFGQNRDAQPKPNPFENTTFNYDANSILSSNNYLTNVTFESVQYKDRNGDLITTPEVTFEAILVSVTFPRVIVKTEIVGRNGTVKEYIGEGDAQITFRGVITAANGQHPTDEIANLKKIFDAPVPIPVSSQYLQNLDIKTVVFDSRSMEQTEGGYSYQSFTINAISDIAQEVEILQ